MTAKNLNALCSPRDSGISASASLAMRPPNFSFASPLGRLALQYLRPLKTNCGEIVVNRYISVSPRAIWSLNIKEAQIYPPGQTPGLFNLTKIEARLRNAAAR